MNIKIEYPPNIKDLEKAFTLTNRIVFTYGDTIYNPNNGYLEEAIIKHEEVHSKQQGDNPQEWWDKYLKDVDFRLEQELEAYKVQYKTIQLTLKDKGRLFQYAMGLARDLSSGMYGNIIATDVALNKITN